MPGVFHAQPSCVPPARGRRGGGLRPAAGPGGTGLRQEAPALPPAKLFDTDPDRYWAELRRQWLLAADHVNLNCGSVGCSPLPVLNAMIDHLLSAEAFREPAYPWFGYEENPRLRELRDALAAFLHCKRDELALVRNATEAQQRRLQRPRPEGRATRSS